MKAIKTCLLLSLLAVLILSCGNPAKDSQEKKDATVTISSSDINVIYFHGTRRCKTCISVGKVAKEHVSQLVNEKVKFLDINIDAPENAKIAEKYEASGSSLMVCKGDQKSDITVMAFQNAVNSPDKVKEELTKQIKKFD